MAEKDTATVTENTIGTQNADGGAVAAYFEKEERQRSEPTEDQPTETPEETPPETEEKPEEDETETPEETKESETKEDTEEPEEEGESEEEEPEPEEEPEKTKPHHDKVLSQLTQEQRKAVNDVITARIGKQAARRRNAEAALKEAQTSFNQRLEQIEAQYKAADPVPSVSDSDPLSKISTPAELSKFKEEAMKVVEWAEDKLEDGEQEVEYEGQIYTRKQIKVMRRDAKRDVEINLPARQKWLEHHEKSEKTTLATFPWLNDPADPRNIEVKAQLKKRPHLGADPDAKGLIALAITGAIYLQEQQKKNGKAKDPPKKKEAAPPVAAPSVVPARRSTASADVEKLAQKRSELTTKNMSRDSLREYFTEQEKHRR